jgi:hypothetical protein
MLAPAAVRSSPMNLTVSGSPVFLQQLFAF